MVRRSRKFVSATAPEFALISLFGVFQNRTKRLTFILFQFERPANVSNPLVRHLIIDRKIFTGDGCDEPSCDPYDDGVQPQPPYPPWVT
jgi:hypothetical protein